MNRRLRKILRRTGLLTLPPMAILLFWALVWPGCTWPTKSQMATKGPRAGRAVLAAGVKPAGYAAIVYSYKSEVNLGGLENLHPGDSHRQGKIYKALVAAGVIGAGDVFVPEPASDAELLAVHDAAYLESLRHSGNVAKAVEAPAIASLPDATCQSGVVDPFRVATGGTVLAAELAMEHGLAFNLGGGFQHAFRDHGEGFCLFADVPLAIHTLRKNGQARKALIVDLDIHQENGFASYYVNDKDVRILQIYEKDNYPPAKQPMSNPLPIEFGISEADYIALLHANLPKLLDEFKPDVVFYVAGTDPYSGDHLGHAKVSATGLVNRDLFVIRQARQRNIPTVMVLAGGYSDQAWRISYRSIYAALTGRDPDSLDTGSDAQDKAHVKGK